MTDNQFNQLFGLVTKCVNGIQKLDERVEKLEAGQAKLEASQVKLEDGLVKLEAGQAKLEDGQEKIVQRFSDVEVELKRLGKAFTIVHAESLDNRVRIEILEEERLPSN